MIIKLDLAQYSFFHHHFNPIQGSVLTSSGFSLFPIAIAGD
jgi:hypothetical protein